MCILRLGRIANVSYSTKNCNSSWSHLSLSPHTCMLKCLVLKSVWSMYAACCKPHPESLPAGLINSKCFDAAWKDTHKCYASFLSKKNTFLCYSSFFHAFICNLVGFNQLPWVFSVWGTGGHCWHDHAGHISKSRQIELISEEMINRTFKLQRTRAGCGFSCESVRVW